MNKGKVRSVLKKIIIVFLIILVGQLFFKIFIVPDIVLKKISLHSDIPLTDSEIYSMIGIEKGEYYYNIRPDEIRKRLESYPEIRKVYVEKVFPDKLKLYIYKRDAVAQSVLKVDEKSFPVAIDNNGIVYSAGRDMDSWDLPVITGIRFSSLELGMELPTPLKPLFKDLKELKVSEPDMFSLLSEIRIERRGENGFDLILFLNSYPISARIGNELDGKVLKYIIMVFEVLAGQKLIGKIGEVDFRTKEIVYHLRGEV